MSEPQVKPSESLARFIIEESKIRKSDNSVKLGAFLPAPTDLTTSVFRIDALPKDQVAEIGRQHVASARDKPLYGWGQLMTKDVTGAGLDVAVDTKPHPLHANIIGWSSDRSAQKLQAMKLAENATLVLV